MRIRFALATLALTVVTGFSAVAGNGRQATAAQLLHGWNNISYLGASAAPSEALSGIAGQYAAVYRWDPVAQTYQLYAPGVPGYVNTLAQINPGDAIWVQYTQAAGELNTGSVGGTTPSGGSGKLSIAASTFMPMSDLAIYEKNFNEVKPAGNDVASQRYFAPVTLPHGATITTMTAAFEGTGDTVKVRLDYTALTNGETSSAVYKLAEVLSSAGGSPQTATAFAHTVDNGANVYFLVVDLTGGPASKLRGVTISYTF
ncbi:MAG: hypothetical protein IPI33_00965 [Dehalococcoidia bacterium]|jgi:hypothetical protein|uniref:hypothetical protein n=1 Tax=Candidatus Amarobacter glycogenicus TaxID=3140699 RepID=UPI001D4E0046|nr:hypothetical protein [Dehalococcoidia bacterium]MBK6560607.1 hypothetical protein [Dehalococcoidia bacterium]MBK7124952.1 hypothetical protein [Dehalococcoidia bacterium]MBK7329005.1 hypothetical protein [Dehalococcoidia bacterium]MBK7723851.1 hypothetical protein [Dehalococcoidia bacterium]